MSTERYRVIALNDGLDGQSGQNWHECEPGEAVHCYAVEDSNPDADWLAEGTWETREPAEAAAAALNAKESEK